MNPRNSHTHCQVAQADTQAKTWQRVCLPHPEKIEFKKFPFPSENKKYATAQTNTTNKKGQLNSILTMVYRHGGQERQHTTAVWRNGGCSASFDSFVVGSSVVLRLNFCAKNPPLRQAAKRCASY
jgi:hypothetical protein